MLPFKKPVPNKNESSLHFFLKQVALAILARSFKCNIVATEVGNMLEYDQEREMLRKSKYAKRSNNTADAVGININTFNLKKKGTVRCIEVKVSRSDFQNGYCISGDLNYVLTPKGLVKIDELYPGVGLIEVDLDELRFYRNGKIKGVEITKRPARAKRELTKVKEDWIYERILLAALVRSRNLIIYGNPWFYPGFNKEENKRLLKDLG